jgi:hypothetical protein
MRLILAPKHREGINEKLIKSWDRKLGQNYLQKLWKWKTLQLKIGDNLTLKHGYIVANQDFHCTALDAIEPTIYWFTSRWPPRWCHVHHPPSLLHQFWGKTGKILARLASQRSKPPDVDVCPHTVFIHSLVLRHKSTNLLPLGFEVQTKKLSLLFRGQPTDNPLPPVLRLNRKTHASRLLHVYDVDRTRRHPTSWFFGHRVPNLCLIFPNPIPASILVVARHVTFAIYTSRDKQTCFSKLNNSICG